MKWAQQLKSVTTVQGNITCRSPGKCSVLLEPYINLVISLICWDILEGTVLSVKLESTVALSFEQTEDHGVKVPWHLLDERLAEKCTSKASLKMGRSARPDTGTVGSW